MKEMLTLAVAPHTNSLMQGPLEPSTLLAADFTSCVTLKTLFINLYSQQLNFLAGVITL